MKITTSIATLATAGLSMVTAQSGVYTNMTSLTTGYEQFNATTVALSPYPFCHNKQVCITLTGTLLRPIIQGAEYHVTGRYLGRLVYTDVDNDLCASLSAAGMSCPIAIGTSALNLCRTLRYNFPPNFPAFWRHQASNGDGGTIFDQQTRTSESLVMCS